MNHHMRTVEQLVLSEYITHDILRLIRHFNLLHPCTMQSINKKSSCVENPGANVD